MQFALCNDEEPISFSTTKLKIKQKNVNNGSSFIYIYIYSFYTGTYRVPALVPVADMYCAVQCTQSLYKCMHTENR